MQPQPSRLPQGASPVPHLLRAWHERAAETGADPGLLRHEFLDDVTDRLLCALAVGVTAANQPCPDGCCSNLQWRGWRWHPDGARARLEHPPRIDRSSR